MVSLGLLNNLVQLRNLSFYLRIANEFTPSIQFEGGKYCDLILLEGNYTQLPQNLNPERQ